MSEPLPDGLYETVLSQALVDALGARPDDEVRMADLRPADAAERLARHVATELHRAIEALPEHDRTARAVALVQDLLAVIDGVVPAAETARHAPLGRRQILRALGTRLPDSRVRFPAPPTMPLTDTALLANAPGEPTVGSQILSELASADAVDLVMAFIRRSGLRPLRKALADHCAAGRPLRVLTTVYTGSTERRALDELRDLGADIRVSYDTTTTRLHAKAWLFTRRSGYSTAYVGSSNLTHAAQGNGQEWNVRVSAARDPAVVDRLAALFGSYWEGEHFRAYDPSAFDAALARSVPARGPVTLVSPVEVRPEPFQDRLLEQVAAAREAGHHRNLLVAATGTGKTVMAALDYRRLHDQLGRSRLLFVAHRSEIFDQALATYRQVLGRADFGETWVGGSRPERFQHVFASVQSLRAADLSALAPDHFDVVVVDEFHHAAAPSYRVLFEHLRPVELLGLTATPERADGLDVLSLFGGRVAAELRIWDAIDQGYLSPFTYYGVHDGTDLRGVPWRRGRGYDVEAVTALYTADDAWARTVWNLVVEYVDDPATMRALGFCVSVEHAEFMAARFTGLGITAVAVSGRTPDVERRQALADLRAGRVQIVFSVDLFNEGVDVPAVDVVLLLRPTESATVFLQQLGRGLRRAPGKVSCTVLDLVGTHHAGFRFEDRFRALLGGSRTDLVRSIEQGFPFLPSGCVMQLDAVAQSVILRSLQTALPTRWPQKVEELRALASTGPVSLAEFLRETGLDLDDLYTTRRSWTDLREAAGLTIAPSGPVEPQLRPAAGRIVHVDDHLRLDAYRHLLDQDRLDVSRLSETERRLAKMLTVSVAGADVLGTADQLQQAVDVVWSHANLRDELREVLDVLDGRVDHLHPPVPALGDSPLRVHAQYSRVEILAALGEGAGAATPQWREGVYHAAAARADVLAFTLDKTNGEFSPTTRYRDYAINRSLIHWESQSTTRADSPTGRRYRTHAAANHSILLFARLQQSDRGYWFLGPATYVSHVGERPMAITWRLANPLSGDLFASFAAAVA